MKPKLGCLFLTAAHLPEGLDWLSQAEHRHLATLRVPKRRTDWLLGRWVAKQAVLLSRETELTRPRLSALEIWPTAAGKPQVFQGGGLLPIAISLSHSAGGALGAVFAAGSVGCDLEWIEERSAAFVEDYFTLEEQDLITSFEGQRRALMANGLWSAKESVLKLLGLGLRIDTQTIAIEVSGPPNHLEWRRLSAFRSTETGEIKGWWRIRDNWVLTVFSEIESLSPTELTD